MPNREAILDAFYASLDASTGINLVQRETQSGFDFGESDYPACIIVAGQETKSRFAYGGGSTSTGVADMQSEFMVGVAGFCRSVASTDDLDTGRGDLIAAIEKAIMRSTSISDLGIVLDVIPETEESDEGYSEGLGWVKSMFRVKYVYNHANP